MAHSTRILRFLLVLLLISVKPFILALPEETEYTGTYIVDGQADDKKWGAFPIGFDFVFFGNTYNEFFVSSNGLVMFGAGSNQFSNLSIPDATRPDNYIALFWDDLIVHVTGDIMYRTIGVAPNRKLVIQFSNMSFWTSTVLLGTMQVILYEGSNEIQLQYKSIIDVSSERASGAEATIGLENSDGTAGVLCSYNTPGYIYSGKAIRFRPDGDTYTFDDQALYDGVLLVDVIPKAGVPDLISPAHNSVVGETVTFNWEAASNATAYFVIISQNSDLSSPLHTSADLTDLSYEYTLAPDQTYYWSANARNSEGTVSWSEIWRFQTSSSPPLLAVPKTINLEQGDLQELVLSYTGGDEGSKTATISSLPGEGILYQSSGGTPSDQISSVPTDIKDAAFRLFYSASGAAGTGAGNFNFHFTDGTGTSPDAAYTIHVSPPGVPVFQYASKEIDRVEITFDRNMADPTGKHLEFAVRDDGVDVTPTSCVLKTGDPATIVLYVAPSLDTTHTITVAYTKGTVTSESGGSLESFDFQVAGKVAQNISFGLLPARTYGDADFELSASASSGLPVSFSSSNSAVVSITGTTATIHNAGEAYIYATQDGDNTFSAVTVEQIQVINKAPATVTLSDLTHDYTGTEMPVTVTTGPADLNVHVTYDGSTNVPTDLGSYTVVAEIVETNYMGTASGLFTIADVSPPVPDLATLPILFNECSVTPLPPTATDTYAGVITGTTGTPFPITAQGTTVITWTYDDGNGNTSTQTQNVAINDENDPEIPTLTDQFVGCAEPVSAPTTTDDCAGTITGTTTDPLTYTTEGTYVINWTFDDGHGNSVAAAQNVTVADLIPPETPVLADLTGDCSVTATAPTTFDACAGTITGTTTDPLTYAAEGTYVINWTFDDGNGNSIMVPQNVIVSDLTPPVAPALADLIGDCSVTAIVPTTTDACAGTITGTTMDPLTYDIQGTYVINWTFDDGNGNSVSVAQNVSVADVTPPVVPTLPDLRDECSVTAVAPTTSDNCAGTITGTTTDALTYDTEGSYVITWTFDDGNGNSIDVDQNVFVDDVTDPVTPTLPDLTGECSVTASAPTTTDNCAGTLTGTTTDPLTYDTEGSYVITWTFDDGNGNSIDVDQNVFVDDVTDPDLPTLSDLTGECSVTASVPTTTDNCTGTITGTTTDPLTYSTQGSYVINWTFDDGNGNQVYVPQNVIVSDQTPPTAIAPSNVTTCDGTVGSIGLTAVTDNCSTPVGTYTLTGATTGSGSGTDASSTLFNPGVTTVTYSLNDGNGNSSEYVVTVSYQVVEEIVVTASGGTLTCENSGSYQWINCADNSIIEGETGKTFSPGVNGSYAVILTQGDCSETSDCYSLDYTGIGDEQSQDYRIYPNPAHAYVTLDMAGEQTHATIRIVDMTGQVIRVEELDRFSRVDLDLSELMNGLYMVHIHSDQMDSVARIIKE